MAWWEAGARILLAILIGLAIGYERERRNKPAGTRTHILVCLGAEVSRSIQKLARDNNCAVLTTPLDTYTVAHRISQCMPVKAFMRTKDLVTFTPSDYTDAIKDTMQNTRIRDFPVIDKNGKYVGMISRRNLLGIRKRSVILSLIHI